MKTALKKLLQKNKTDIDAKPFKEKKLIFYIFETTRKKPLYILSEVPEALFFIKPQYINL